MANVYAVKSGNWSDVTVWNTGVLPTSVDTVRPNGFIVAIDQNITVGLIVNDASSPSVSGGYFTVSAGNYTITADIEGRASSASSGVLSITNSCTVVGNIRGNQISSSSNHVGVVVQNNVTLNLIGNVKAGLGNSAYGLSMNGLSCIVNMTGTVEGGDSNTVSAGIRLNASNCKLNLDGVAVGGLVTAAISSGVNNCILEGNVTASPNSVTNFIGVSNGGLSPYVRVKNLIFGGMAKDVFFAANQPTFTHLGSTGASLTLTDPSTTDQALPSDVRNAVSYNSGASVGTLIVPDPASVGKGVPTDNTVGTAALTPEAVWNLAISSLTSTGSIGERLKNCSTVETTGAQLASF